MSGIWEYLRKNWGAPLVLAFIWLLLVSGGQLALGYTTLANEIATYAFYCLVAGVALQVASYVRYRNQADSQQEETHGGMSRRSYALIGLVAILVIGGTAAAVYLPGASSGLTVSTTTISGQVVTVTISTASSQTLSASATDVSALPEPDGSTVITFSVSITDGSAPFNITAFWSDGFNQSSTTGSFFRTIPANQALPTSATVRVVDSKNQLITLTVEVPSVTATNSTESTTSTNTTNTSQTSVTSTTRSTLSTSKSSSYTGTFPPLDVLAYPVKETTQANGSVLAEFNVSVTGGEAPYTYTANWSDGVTQTSSDGAFGRLFSSTGQIPPDVTVTVTSADGQTSQVEILT